MNPVGWLDLRVLSPRHVRKNPGTTRLQKWTGDGSERVAQAAFSDPPDSWLSRGDGTSMSSTTRSSASIFFLKLSRPPRVVQKYRNFQEKQKRKIPPRAVAPVALLPDPRSACLEPSGESQQMCTDNVQRSLCSRMHSISFVERGSKRVAVVDPKGSG